MILKQATERTEDEGNLYINMCITGNLFHLKSLWAHSYFMKQLVRKLLIANDVAVAVYPACALAGNVLYYKKITEFFDFKDSKKKMIIVQQCVLKKRKLYQLPSIFISQTKLGTVQHFTPPIMVASYDLMNKDISNRLAKRNQGFDRLYKHV